MESLSSYFFTSRPSERKLPPYSRKKLSILTLLFLDAASAKDAGNIDYGAPELERRVKKVQERVSEVSYLTANEPSVALYRIQEHVRKTTSALLTERVSPTVLCGKQVVLRGAKRQTVSHFSTRCSSFRLLFKSG